MKRHLLFLSLLSSIQKLGGPDTLDREPNRLMASYMACLTLDYFKYFCLNYNRLRRAKLTVTEKVRTLKAMVIMKMVSF